ncbi:MAG: hypothetical protein MI810_17750, partial [Flavobacteriales bacterium]|nr:hypothetical protein [Flavobacteriales bacterium]
MKLPIVPLLSSILILLFSCNSKCSLSNFDIVGKWDVDKFDIFGGQDKVKNFCDPQDIDYDEYSCETKM